MARRLRVAALAAAFLFALGCGDELRSLQISRLPENPIIAADMLPGSDGANINGPSLIRAPEWVPNRLGEYYLYFAHHRGEYIRLAYADRIEGPWTVYAPGTLQLNDAPACRHHVASPDVHVIENTRQVRMYFHCPTGGGQKTFIATSGDGLSYTAGDVPVADFYLRAVRWRNGWFGMAKGGRMYLSDDGLTFDELPAPAFPMTDARGNDPGSVRHVALKVAGDKADVYFTRIGDAPESVLFSRIDLSQPKEQWSASEPVLLLSPENEWEGADIPVAPSRSGASRRRENALRDPAIYEDADGRTYLLYSVAGEAGIAVATLITPE